VLIVMMLGDQSPPRWMLNSLVSFGVFCCSNTPIELYSSGPNEFVDRELLIINSSEIRWKPSLEIKKNFVFKFTEFSLCLREADFFFVEFSEGAKKKARSGAT
jgi:hypothetical protein